MSITTRSSRWSKATVRNAAAPARVAPSAPVIPDAALAPPPPSPAPADGLLKASEKDSELQIVITPASTTVSYDSFVLLLDGNQQGNAHSFDDQADFPTFSMPLPAGVRTEGPHQLSYRLDYFSGSSEVSDPTPLMVDLHHAGSPETLPMLTGFDPRVLSDGLSLDLLVELGDKVEATIGAYGGSDPYSSPAPGDVITPYIGSIPGDPITLTNSMAARANITVAFTKDHIDKVTADGKHDFYYTITDRAGNLSPNSFAQSIAILVKTGITDFLAPVIEAAGSASGDIILEAEARAGVKVTIPGHPDLLLNDEVYVVWDGSDQPPAPAPGPDTEFDITVEWETLADKGTGDFNVSYYVKRNGGRLGHSPDTPVKVNIDIPGGPDTDPSTPENENLGPLTVVGDVDGQENVVTVDDSTVGAVATVPWFFPDGTTDYFEDGDIIYIIWNGTELSQLAREIDNADIIAEKDIAISIPSATLLSASGNLNVAYKVTREVTSASGFNSAYSPAQVVDVKSANGAPGGTAPLGESVLPEEGIFFHAVLNAWVINVTVLQGGTPIEIPHYLNKKAGDIINITFTAKGELDGSGADIPAAKWEVIDYPVPAGDEENEASLFTLPEANLKEVTPYGRGVIKYSVKNDIATKDGVEVEVVIDNRGGQSRSATL